MMRAAGMRSLRAMAGASAGTTALPVEWMYGKLKEHGTDYYCGVPDSLLKDFCAYVTDHAPRERHHITANEGASIGLAMGHYMATGEVPLVYMQNSGLGNTVNPLTSLVDPEVYGIPMLLMVGWRGQPGVKDEPQHVKMGRITPKVLEALGIPTHVLPSEQGAAEAVLEEVHAYMHANSAPVALLVEKSTFGPYTLQSKAVERFPLSRETAIRTLVTSLEKDTVFVCTTGKASRELYEVREAMQMPQRDFLTVGGMGHTSSIALGVAAGRPGAHVVCLDGDGSLLMHMGSLALVGDVGPRNFVHVVLNNGAHESVGGQPTLGHRMDIGGVARSCGYRRVDIVRTEQELLDATRSIGKADGPILLEVLTNLESRNDLGRPKTSSYENRKAFQRFLHDL